MYKTVTPENITVSSETVKIDITTTLQYKRVQQTLI